jgi:hypothetical protein
VACSARTANYGQGAVLPKVFFITHPDGASPRATAETAFDGLSRKLLLRSWKSIDADGYGEGRVV